MLLSRYHRDIELAREIRGDEYMELILRAALPIISYCLASILMTVINKFVVSGSQFTMTFLRELNITQRVKLDTS